MGEDEGRIMEAKIRIRSLCHQPGINLLKDQRGRVDEADILPEDSPALTDWLALEGDAQSAQHELEGPALQYRCK